MYSINMITYAFITFEWDEAKASLNLKKHGVSFEEASTVFYDPHALLIDDETHSQEEQRFILLGISAKSRVLTVCHCFREAYDLVRIISARKATKREEADYWRKRYEG